jgi:hypothetical protein
MLLVITKTENKNKSPFCQKLEWALNKQQIICFLSFSWYQQHYYLL